MSISRFMPAICAAIVLFGCLVPTKLNLITLPQSFHWTDPPTSGPMASVFQTMMATTGMQEAKSGLMAGRTIAYFVYLVPLTALWTVVANLRGFVSRGSQVLAGLVWLACGTSVPLLAISTVLEAMRKMPMMSMLGPAAQISAGQVLAADPGAWVIAIGALAMLASGFGLLDFIDDDRVQVPREDGS